jgi:hypothetical protein
MRGIAKFSGDCNLDDSAVNPDFAGCALQGASHLNLLSLRQPRSFIF